jgi:hypothetical protein
MAFYVYGLMRVRDARVAAAAGPVEARLEAVVCEGVAALGSNAGDDSVKLRREAVVGHTDVLQAAFEHGPILPLRFGTVLADREAITAELLAPRAQALLARLDWLEQRAEMRLKADYLEEPLLRSVLDRDPALARAAKRMRELPAAASHFERIRIGEAIAAAVHGRRTVDADAMLAALAPLCVSVSASDPRHEHAVLSAAFLLDRAGLERFDGAVEELSRVHADRMQLKLIGPMPAYSFADREWEAEGKHAHANEAVATWG